MTMISFSRGKQHYFYKGCSWNIDTCGNSANKNCKIVPGCAYAPWKRTPTQHGTPCAVLAGVFWITPMWLSRVRAIEEDSHGQAFQFRWRGSWGSGTVVHPATPVLLCGGYNETCAALGQVPKQWWSVPVACLVLPFVWCHCGVVVVVKYILYTFLDPCLCLTWTTLIVLLYYYYCIFFWRL
jgi:hypothetical protein